MAARFWVYPDAYSRPNEIQCEIDDLDEEWSSMLSDPQVTEDKTRSLALCSAEFPKGATTRHEVQLVASHGLVLDIDKWDSRKPFTAVELRERLAGCRAVIWNTYSSTPEELRWRAVVPVREPLPPRYYRSLWRWFNENILEHTMAANTCNPGRFGFFGSVKTETARTHYQWSLLDGSLFDWRLIEDELNEEELGLPLQPLKPTDLSRSPDWTSDAQALQEAKRYFGRVGVGQGVGERHNTLIRVGIKCWWDWALPDEKAVYEVLSLVNNNFDEPQSENEVKTEVQASYDRTLGPGRVEQPASYGHEREPTIRFSVNALRDLSRQIITSKRHNARTVGSALKALAEGEAFAEPVEARGVLYTAVEEIGRSFPREAPERILDILRRGLGAQRVRSGEQYPLPTDSELTTKIRYTQTSINKRIEEREEAKKDRIRSAILRAFKGKRDTPYTSREYKAWEANGFDDSQWILQNGGGYYVWVDGTYLGPYAREEAAHWIATCLSPAHERIKLSSVSSKDGAVKAKTLEDLVREFGTVIDHVEHSMCADRSEYKEDQGTLVKAVAPLRPLNPERSEEVDHWLRLMGQDKYELLCQWISAVTHLDRPLTALLLRLPPNSGKNLLSYGLSRLWRLAGPTVLDTLTSEELERCPMVFCDERLPVTWNKQFPQRLRAFISEGSRSVKKPFFPKYTLSGYARLIFSGNSIADVITSSEHLDSDGIKALTERILFINHDSKEASQYFKNIPHSHWVEQDTIAKHALWLRDNYKAATSGRFFVSDKSNDVELALFTTNEKTSKVLEAVYTYVANGRYSFDAVVLDDQGGLYINSTRLYEYWDELDHSRRAPRSGEIVKALALVCEGRQALYVGENKDLKWYRKLKPDTMDHWMTEARVEPEKFLAALSKLAEKKIRLIGALKL